MCQDVKICNVCKIEKPLEDFKKAIENKDGRTRKCKQCFKDKLYTEEVIYKPEEGYKKCSYCKIEKLEEAFYFRNKQKGTKQPMCKKCNHLRQRKYRANNKEKSLKYDVEYTKNRIKTDPVFKFKNYIRKTLKRAHKKFLAEGSKSPKAEEILGCSLNFFKEYIESLFEENMSWENHGHCKIGNCDVWNIDHKIPLSTAKTEKEALLLNHYTNLQPMWAIDNLRKGSKILETYLNK